METMINAKNDLIQKMSSHLKGMGYLSCLNLSCLVVYPNLMLNLNAATCLDVNTFLLQKRIILQLKMLNAYVTKIVTEDSPFLLDKNEYCIINCKYFAKTEKN